MIVWGYKTRLFKKHKIQGKCPACKSESVNVVGYVRIFDIFWIPVFPYKKMIFVDCDKCSSTYPYEQYKQSIDEQNIKFNMPWWSFLFLIIIFFMLMFDIILKIYQKVFI